MKQMTFKPNKKAVEQLKQKKQIKNLVKYAEALINVKRS